MSRQKSADVELIRLKLLETGLGLLERQGFNATGIQEIATEAGILKGSFYNYFESKESFAVSIIRHYAETHLESWKLLLEGLGAGDPYDSLRPAFSAIVSRYERSSPRKGCLIGNLAGEISEASEECRRAMHEAISLFKAVLEERLAAGQRAGKVRADLSAAQLADLFWDAWQGSLLRMKIENSVEPVTTTLELLFTRMLNARCGEGIVNGTDQD